MRKKRMPIQVLEAIIPWVAVALWSCAEKEHFDPCKDVSCSGRGICAIAGDEAVCVCDAGCHAEGLNCVEDPDPCAGINCSGHGVCAITSEGNPVCVCDERYYPVGIECLEEPRPCDGVTCSDHGICAISGVGAVCVCDAGYHAEGLNCVEDPDPCAGINCSGHGVCAITSERNPICVCDPGFRNHWPLYCVPEPSPEVCNQYGWCFPENPLTDGRFHDIWCRAADDIWIVGPPGTIFHWDGGTWMQVPSGTDAGLKGVFGVDSADVMAVGGGIRGDLLYSQILRWNGSRWSIELDVDRKVIEDVWGSAPNDYWVVDVNHHSILHWDGSKWTEFVTSVVNGIWGKNAEDIWAFGILYSVFHWNGAIWSRVTPEIGYVDDCHFNAAWSADENSLWLVGTHYMWDGEYGRYYFSSFYWDGTEFHDYHTVDVVELYDVSGFAADDIWTVGTGGAIYQWDATRWSRIPSGVTSDLYGICTVDNQVWIVGSNGTILHRR